ncbi:zinc finger protein 836 [Notolabrus celidotus]|uniref:zinc finger protein 836 n=1 Tax=Notolabrus celidotus TaxID=1203425 RepID=UPI00148FDDCC|nr:zinc finger protein 836 [Notolabrus celidotus]
MRTRRRVRMKREKAVSSVEYVVSDDDGHVCKMYGEKSDDSTSSESDDEKKKPTKPAGFCPGDPESDGESSSTDDSSDSSHLSKSKASPAVVPSNKNSICANCGRGPFRSLKLHLLHCSGVKVKYQCFLCKELFATQKLLNEHYMSLYSCDICGQVFSNEVMYYQHPCPKKSKSPLSLFCSESMPQVCNICKSFFTSERTLLHHVTKVHTSVVSTKVCIIGKPSMLTDKQILPATHSALINPDAFNLALNGKLNDGQADEPSPYSFLLGRPTCIASSATPFRAETNDATEVSPDKTPASTDSGSLQTPTILAMFENDSHDVALMKRMNTGWRSKAPHPCRQCGAIFRQPSLIISHRYLHRGRRLHQCQCGRAFKHQLHLLRHCVQHSENMSYICVSCGGTFAGATVLANHLKGKSLKKSHPGCKPKRKVKQKCRMPFTCDCGQLFFRPSAYIWHQLKNRTKTKCVKKHLK